MLEIVLIKFVFLLYIFLKTCTHLSLKSYMKHYDVNIIENLISIEVNDLILRTFINSNKIYS